MTLAISPLVLNTLMNITKVNSTKAAETSPKAAIVSPASTQLNVTQMADAIRGCENVGAVDRNNIEKYAKAHVGFYERAMKSGATATNAKFFVLDKLLKGEIKVEDLDDCALKISGKNGQSILVRVIKNEKGNYNIYSQEGSMDFEAFKKTPINALSMSSSFTTSSLKGEFVRNFNAYYEKYHQA